MSGKNIESITVKLLNPHKIIEMSYGEITSDKTYNVLTRKPEKGGLHCQQIFGPEERGICGCGIYHKNYKKTKIRCRDCDVDVTDPAVRRVRFGHITLMIPVVHIWYRQIIATLLGIGPKTIDKLINYSVYMITVKGNSPYEISDTITPHEYYEYKKDNLLDKKFKAETGGEFIYRLLQGIDIEALDAELRLKKPSRRVNHRRIIVNSFKNSGMNPEWMMVKVLPVIPADLRPVLIFDDGTMASSDLNDLYSKVFQRNNRLKRLVYYGAPNILMDIAKRSLQDSVDALFDNGRRYTAKNRSGKRAFKSLSQVISSKEGRIRRNLLGKRVDYSGRSVIAVGPDLKLHQCGIPLDMAMDLFKPMVYGRLLRTGFASSLKHAKKIVEARRPEAADALEYEMAEKMVLLNRAPSLHRMSIQAFDPVIISGKAIRLHPLVTSAFNADFDGDQMGVHLPLSIEAQTEARLLMSSVNNIISPASGKLSMAPAQDIVLGVYYLTKERTGCIGEGMVFADKNEALMAYDRQITELHTKIKVRINGIITATTPGRLIFSDVLPDELPFSTVNKLLKKKDLGKLVEMCYEKAGHRATVIILDKIKDMGYKYATISGTSVGMSNITIPKEKQAILIDAEQQVKEINEQFNNGQLSEEEKHNTVIGVWNKASETLTDIMMENFGLSEDITYNSPEERLIAKEFNPVFMMADSGARGSRDQIKQVAGMRGLMAKPNGDIVEIPIKSNLKEGLTYFEYLLACHGARKGRADGALKTANAGYFTRKLVDVAHDVIIKDVKCDAITGFCLSTLYDDNDEIIMPVHERVLYRVVSQRVVSPINGDIIVDAGKIITKEIAHNIKEVGLSTIEVRSPITCSLKHGICAACYGYEITTRDYPLIGEAVGIIAGQSVGEPGTQLTLRTFHAGGIASGGAGKSSIIASEFGTLRLKDVKTIQNREGNKVVTGRNGRAAILINGIERDLGRIPFGAVIMKEDGADIEKSERIASWDPHAMPIITTNAGTTTFLDIIENITVKSETNPVTGAVQRKIIAIIKDAIPRISVADKEYILSIGAILVVNPRAEVEPGDILAKTPKQAAKNADITGGLSRVLQLLEAKKIQDPAIIADIDGEVRIHPPEGKSLPVEIVNMYDSSVIYNIPIEKQLNYQHGDSILAGDILTNGAIDSRDILRILGYKKAALFIIDEVQKVYKSQGVDINDKHIEIILSKMLSKVMIADAGDSRYIQDEIVSKIEFMSANDLVVGDKATAKQILLGLVNTALSSDSWLSAASFQNTTKVLALAAIKKKTDKLVGIKENLIVGNVIPVGTGSTI